MSQPIDSFYAYLQELEESYGRLAGLLREKVTAVSSFNLTKLEEIMKQEQVYVLLSKGFDTSLQTHREKLGIGGDTLGDIIEQLPAENQESFRAAHKRLRVTLNEVKTLNEKCQSLLEGRLHDLDRSIKALDHSENATYQQSGSEKDKPAPESGFFSKTI